VAPATAACRPAQPGSAECAAIRVPFVSSSSPDAVGPAFEGSGEGGGYTPEEIRLAYDLPSTGGSGQTVAIVDPFNDPLAYENLKTYRSRYGLPECTEASGCFKKVNQRGEAKSYPENSVEWGGEISLDLAMVSATCAECKLLLVEAENNKWQLIGEAENEAVKLGANVVNDSLYEKESSSFEKFYEETGLSYFDHPGVPITVASGDNGYGVGFPAGTPYAIAVGGTSLKKEVGSTRGWAEEVWRNAGYKVGEKGAGTGSGCALKIEKKPSWQHDAHCESRTDNDVAAVASTSTPVSSLDSYGEKGWVNWGGTSVSAPILAGVEALAEKPVKELGAQIFYEKPSEEFAVTKGSDGECGGLYLCTAGEGYNGPAGLGAPDGVPTLEYVTGITENEATLHGVVNPEGVTTKYLFESGTTESYGSKTAEASAGSGTSGVEVSKTITGLAANTKYHYRIVAANSNGTLHGTDEVFSTTYWSLQEPLDPAGAKEGYLNGVSCTSFTECTGAGYFENTAEEFVSLAERWNGTSWTAQEPPIPTGATVSALTGISCTSSTKCTGVGYFKNSAGSFVPLAEAWNGTSWTVQEPPNPAGFTESVLWGVSCASSTACTAGGRFVNATARWVPLAERWNGTSWTAQEPPSPTGSKEATFAAISCASSAECIGVGFFENSSEKWVPLAERWNGTSWTAQEPPIPAGAKVDYLEGVSCTSSSACIAVGELENSSEKWVPLAETWNGTSWTAHELSMPTGAKWAYLKAVSCTSGTECTGVGYEENSSSKVVPLAERLNGTSWTAQSPPSPSGAKEGFLKGVACTSSTECVAAGGLQTSSSTYLPLAERYQ